jgi:anti-sigma B factor antagonist
LTPPLPRIKLLSGAEGPAAMELKIRKSQEIYIVDVQGELDLYNAYKLKELLTKMLEKKIERFIINLDEVEYIDSSGIGALIYISSTVKKSNLKLAITNVHGSVQKVMELTKLMDYFPITATLDEAMKKVGAQPDA